MPDAFDSVDVVLTILGWVLTLAVLLLAIGFRVEAWWKARR